MGAPSKILNWFPFLETEGQRPPRAREKSKKDSMTTTFLTTLVFLALEDEVVVVATSAPFPESLVVFTKKNEELPIAFALFPLSLVVVDLLALVVSTDNEEVVVVSFPLSLVVVDLLALVVSTDNEEVVVVSFPLSLVDVDLLALVVSTDDDEDVFVSFPAFVVLASDDEVEDEPTKLAVLDESTTAPGPAATALAWNKNQHVFFSSRWKDEEINHLQQLADFSRI